MILIAFLAVIADRPAIALRTVALSALVILALWPETLLDIGFQPAGWERTYTNGGPVTA